MAGPGIGQSSHPQLTHEHELTLDRILPGAKRTPGNADHQLQGTKDRRAFVAHLLTPAHMGLRSTRINQNGDRLLPD